MNSLCAYCGVYNDENDKVCSQCGHLMPNEEARLKAPRGEGKLLKGDQDLKMSYWWAPLVGTGLGLLLALRFAGLQPAAQPNGIINMHFFHYFLYSFFGFVGGGILWLMSTGYFNNKHTQHHPNRSWRVVPAMMLMIVPFLGLLIALWAKRGNRLPGKAKNLADVALLVSATFSVGVILVIVIVSMIQANKPNADAANTGPHHRYYFMNSSGIELPKQVHSPTHKDHHG